LVGAEEWSPSHEDGVGNLEDSRVDFGIAGREAIDKFLASQGLSRGPQGGRGWVSDCENYQSQSIPPPPKVRVGDDADGFAELGPDSWRRRNHQCNNLLLNRLFLVLGYFVVALFVL